MPCSIPWNMHHLCVFGSLHQLAIVMQGKTTRMHFTNVVLLSTAGQRAGADTATPNGRACELTTRSGGTAGKGDSKLTLTHKQTVIVLMHTGLQAQSVLHHPSSSLFHCQGRSHQNLSGQVTFALSCPHALCIGKRVYYS